MVRTKYLNTALIFLMNILFTSLLFASSVKITDFHTSNGFDAKNHKLTNLSDRFDTNTKRIYAAATIHNIFPKTEFVMQWYRYEDKKKHVFYAYREKVSGTRTIFSYFTMNEGYQFPLGKYFIDILMNNNKVVAHTSFKVTGAEMKHDMHKGECSIPTKADNENLISDMLQQYPGVQKDLKELHLRRFGDIQKHFTLLAPSGWQSSRKLAKYDFLRLSRSPKLGETVYALRQIPLDVNITEKYDAKIILRGVAKMIISLGVKNGGKLMNEVNISILHDLALGSFMVAYRSNEKVLYELHTLIYDKRYMYDVVLVTDKQGLEVSRFLSLLSAYSFWTGESCK